MFSAVFLEYITANYHCYHCQCYKIRIYHFFTYMSEGIWLILSVYLTGNTVDSENIAALGETIMWYDTIC